MAAVTSQASGFFIHMLAGKPGRASVGTVVTTVGALRLVAAIGILVYALIAKRPVTYAAAGSSLSHEA